MRSSSVLSITSSGLRCAAVLATAAIIPLLAPTPAQAVRVAVNGNYWTVTPVIGPFGNGTDVGGVDLTILENAPWWGDRELALIFSNHVGLALGTPNLVNPVVKSRGFSPRDPVAPFFAWTFGTPDSFLFPFAPGFEPRSPVVPPLTNVTVATTVPLIFPPDAPTDDFDARVTGLVGAPRTAEAVYARVQGPPVPVPGPLPILGAAAAFGYSRKLRKRIKSSTNAVVTTPGA